LWAIFFSFFKKSLVIKAENEALNYKSEKARGVGVNASPE